MGHDLHTLRVCGVGGLGFRVEGLGFRASLGLRVWGTGFQGLEFRAQGLGRRAQVFRVSGFVGLGCIGFLFEGR